MNLLFSLRKLKKGVNVQKNFNRHNMKNYYLFNVNNVADLKQIDFMEGFLKGLSDEDYLDVTDMSIFLHDLVQQIQINKPENSIEFTKKYFQR